MPIERRSAMEPALAAATGVMAGAAEKKKREQEIDWQRESEIRANQLKMQMQEEEIYREFLNEQRRKQLEDEKWHLARKWELDKAEIASRNDFAKEEEERQKANAEFENQIKEIDKQAAERGWEEDDPHVWNQKVQAALRVKDYNILKANQILGVDKALEQERKRNEAALMRKEVAAYIGQELANLLPLDKGIEEMNKIKARLGEQPEIPAFEGAGAGMTYPYTPAAPPAAVPTVVTDEDYNKLPSGAEFIDEEGKRWRKP